MHKKEYGNWGLTEQLPDPTASENVMVCVWIPETTLHDWDHLPERERHKIGEDVTYFISMRVAQEKRKTEEPKEELLRTGD
jgi:hypothetical protein